MRAWLIVLAACRTAQVPPPAPVTFPAPAPPPPLTATDYVHHLERVALGRLSGELSPGLAYEIRAAHQRCTPMLEEVPGPQAIPGAPPTSTLVIGSCPVPGLSHPRPGIECIPPTTKRVFHVLVDRDGTGFRLVTRSR